MANFDTNYEKISLKIFQRIEGLKNLEFQAGSTLARNVKAEARRSFGEGQSGYPYEFHNSFQSDDVVRYDENQHAVVINHPAARVLEYGIGTQVIRAKDSEYMHFKGKDGKEVLRALLLSWQRRERSFHRPYPASGRFRLRTIRCQNTSCRRERRKRENGGQAFLRLRG